MKALSGCFIVAQVPKQVTPGQGEEVQAAAGASMQRAWHGNRRASPVSPASHRCAVSVTCQQCGVARQSPRFSGPCSWQTCWSVCMPDTLGKCLQSPRTRLAPPVLNGGIFTQRCQRAHERSHSKSAARLGLEPGATWQLCSGGRY